MKKLLFKCALLILFVGAILYVGGAAYRQTNTYKNLERTEGTEIFHSIPKTIDIAVFGCSHGRDAFRFFPDDSSVFSFALSGQSMQYDEKMMLEYGNHFHEGTLVILTVSYISPFRTDPESDFQNKQGRYYRVLSPEHIVDVKRSQYHLQKFSPLLTEEFSSIVSAFSEDVPLKPTLQEQYGYLKLSDTPEETILSEQERIYKAHLSIIEPSLPDGNPVMTDALRRMLSLCQQNGWQAVLTTMPYTSAYNSSFSEGFYQTFYGMMAQLSQEFDVPYLDYSHDPAFSESYNLFQDIQHMNLDGAAKFDKQFFADLQAKKIW